MPKYKNNTVATIKVRGKSIAPGATQRFPDYLKDEKGLTRVDHVPAGTSGGGGSGAPQYYPPRTLIDIQRTPAT